MNTKQIKPTVKRLITNASLKTPQLRIRVTGETAHADTFSKPHSARPARPFAHEKTMYTPLSSSKSTPRRVFHYSPTPSAYEINA